MIRAVVFDIGGVLEVTPDPQLAEFSQRWEAQLGLKPGEFDERLGDVVAAGALGRCSEADFYAALRERVGMDETQLAAYKQEFWSGYLGELNSELASYFAGLRPRYQTAMLSNSFVGAREHEQQAYHYAQICDFIIYSHEVGMEKPDPRIFALTCERLSAQPAEVIFLDDFEPWVAAARDCGLHTIRFQNTAQAIHDIETRLQADAK